MTVKDQSKIHENNKSSQEKRLKTRVHSKANIKGDEKVYERREREYMERLGRKEGRE